MIWTKLMRSCYDKTMQLMAGKKAVSALCMLSFAESSFFPIPPDILMIPLILKQRAQAFRIAFLCTLFSVLGGAFGYLIGLFLYDSIAVPALNYFGAMASFERVKQLYIDYGGWIVLGAGITPLPYKLITIASGVMGMNFLSFMVVSLIGRGIRFFLVAALLWKWGEPMKAYIERNLGWLSVVFFILLIGAFFLIKLF